MKFIILLHKVAYDYVTLFDVYECAIDPELLGENESRKQRESCRQSLLCSLTPETYARTRHRAEGTWRFEFDERTESLSRPETPTRLRDILAKLGVESFRALS